MQIRPFVLSVVAVCVLDLHVSRISHAAVAGQTPRSLEMAIAKNEMIAPNGGLQWRAAAALRRMNTIARDHGAKLMVQIPADALGSATEIQRVAPFSAISEVPARRPFKLVLRVVKHSDRSQSQREPSDVVANASLHNRSNIGLSPQIYLHIRDESQSERAREYAAVLRKMGAYVSDVEIVVAEGPRRNQLRYFHPQDRKEAATLARSLNSPAEVQLLDLSREYGSSVPIRHYELWLAPQNIIPPR